MSDTFETTLSILSKLFLTDGDVQKLDGLILENPSFDFEMLLLESDRQQVVPQVYQNLKSIGLPPEKLAPFRALNFRISMWDIALKKQTKLVWENLNQREISTLGLKGIALDFLYPYKNIRQKSDIDLLVPDMDAAWQVLTILDDLGGDLQVLSIRSMCKPTVELGGEARNLPKYGLSGELAVDLHLGVFPIIAAKVYEGDIWARSQRRSLDGIYLRVPSLEDCLLITCAHIYHHGRVLLRDVNDAYSMLQNSRDRLDWDYILTTAQTNDLEPVLFFLLKTVEMRYQQTFISPHWLAQIEPWGWHRAVIWAFWKSKRLQSFWSFLLVCNHAFPYERKQLGILKGAFESIAGCLYEVENALRGKSSWSQLAFGKLLNIVFGFPRKKIHLNRYRYTELARIHPRNSGKEWKIDRIDINRIWDSPLTQLKLDRISKDILICRMPQGIELALTPIGIYTLHNRYLNGFFTRDIQEIESIAFDFINRLKSEGMAEVRLLNAA